MIYILYAIHVLVSIFLILVVLLQQGKGADLSVFGGGATQAAFGARGSVNILHRLTVACFVIFILTTLSIGLLKARGNPSVMRGVDVEEPATDATEAPEPALAPEPAPGASPSDSPATEAAADDGAAAENGAGEGTGEGTASGADQEPPGAEPESQNPPSGSDG